MTLILCGFKNCGKSTFGAALAQSLGWPFVDSDDLLIEAFNSGGEVAKSVADIYRKLGPPPFRKLECDVITSLQPLKPIVLATGGSTILQESCAHHLKSIGKLIYLRAEREALFSRMTKAATLPAFIDKNAPRASFDDHYNSRVQGYEDIADMIIETDNKSRNQVLEELENLGAFDVQ